VIATILLVCALLLLLLAIAAVALARSAIANALVYGATLVLALVCLGAGAMQLFGGAAPVTVALPLGLPWMGAHFRMDALSAFFIVVVDLGVAAASLFAVGYGRHEQAPARVLPFYPAFVAAMNLVVLADDAFTFLLSWEFMSLSSWALVMAHHHVPENVRAGQVYLVMASFGTLALLLAFGLLAGPDRSQKFAIPILRPRRPRWCCVLSSPARARKQAFFHCTSGCRSRIPLRQATSRP
jgi:hydrogenase-4 component B